MKKSPRLKTFLDQLPKGEGAALLKMLKADPSIALDPAALVAASLHGKSDLVRALLKAGADPEAPTPSHEKYRPLHRAIEHRGFPKNGGHLQTVNILLDAGADPEARSTWMGLTALATAGMTGDAEMIGAVLRRKPARNLFNACILADAARVESILRKKPEAAGGCDVNGMTPLHYAALSGLNSSADQEKLSMIATLLADSGADLDAHPKIGPYPDIAVLHFAAWGKNLAVAKVLLARGANPNLGFPNCLWREPGALGDLFVQHGADVNGLESSGQPLLHSRVHWNLTSVVRWLLEKGSDPNLRDSHGNTALHEAASRGASPNIVEALLAHGAKKTLKNKKGERAGDIAARKHRRSFP